MSEDAAGAVAQDAGGNDLVDIASFSGPQLDGALLDELEALEAVATSPRGTAPIDAFDQDAHWSQRLAMVPTHAMLAKQATKLADLKHKFKIKT